MILAEPHLFCALQKGSLSCEHCGQLESAAIHAQLFKFDPVSAPAHYLQRDPQAVEVIAAWQLDFFLGNVVKYINRAPHKQHELQDLKKARKYLDMKIELLERGKLKETIVTHEQTINRAGGSSDLERLGG